ncbi:unnamed protein product [Brachionus calyciflorus]|uniref:Dehydrogenase/reductase SDR family member 4 n=1 Tax=Brachionus calyciflorus TaxID=104777 RepID=A0A813MEV0_9BILA|nr:unnamed protein product [Brachionus calyciflorus]
MEKRFLNKIALITGSTEGIGFSIAQRLGREGAKVVICSRKQEKVTKAVEQLKVENLDCLGVVCHVGIEDDRRNLIEKTIEKYGGIDILVCNVAVNPHHGNIFEIDERQWDKIFDINVKSTFLLIKQAIPFLKQRKDSNVLIISSIAGYYPSQIIAPYSISKTPLIGMTKAMGPACAELGIRVNCIAPGVIKTKFSKAFWYDEPIYNDCFMKRVGYSDEVAATAAFLCSNDASYITGETIICAGGANARL